MDDQLAEMAKQKLLSILDWTDLPHLKEQKINTKSQILRHCITSTEEMFLDQRNRFRKLTNEITNMTHQRATLSKTEHSINAKEENIMEQHSIMTELSNGLMRVHDEYEAIGGDSIEDEDFIGDDPQSNQRDLDRVRNEITKISSAAIGFDLDSLERLRQKTRTYKIFRDILVRIRGWNFYDLLNKLSKVRANVEVVIVEDIQKEMQRLFRSIVPEGEINLIPLYSTEVRTYHFQYLSFLFLIEKWVHILRMIRSRLWELDILLNAGQTM